MKNIIILKDLYETEMYSVDAPLIWAVLVTEKTKDEVRTIISKVKNRGPSVYNFGELKEELVKNGIEVYDTVGEIYW